MINSDNKNYYELGNKNSISSYPISLYVEGSNQIKIRLTIGGKSVLDRTVGSPQVYQGQYVSGTFTPD